MEVLPQSLTLTISKTFGHACQSQEKESVSFFVLGELFTSVPIFFEAPGLRCSEHSNQALLAGEAYRSVANCGRLVKGLTFRNRQSWPYHGHCITWLK